MIKFLDLQAQYTSIKGEIDAAIADVIADAAFIGGAPVRAFEAAFAHYLGVDHCIGVGNGTDALEIAIEALRLPRGSHVVVPANSFIASAEAVTRSSCSPIFADVDPDSYTLSAETLRKSLTSETRAVIVVHLYGHPCDMDGIDAVAREHGLTIIEDCAQAHGAEYRGRKVGSFGACAAFSFYPGKNLGAYGDAGAIVTSDLELAQRARQIANHGRLTKYDHEFEGRNSRLDGLQAAILRVKLAHLERWTEHRIAIANLYLNGLRDIPGVILPARQTWARQVYHLFVVRTERRDELAAHLLAQGIETGIHYPKALPKQFAYRDHPQASADMFACRADSTLLSLPIGEHISPANAEAVVKVIRGFFASDATSAVG